jgi:hypothetical protein
MRKEQCAALRLCRAPLCKAGGRHGLAPDPPPESFA